MTQMASQVVEKEKFQNVFDAQRRRSINFRNEPLSARKQRLRNLRKCILTNEALIFEAVQKDLGKPEVEVRISEIRPCLAEIRKMLTNLDLWAGVHYVETPISFVGTSAALKYEPKGVTLIIAPWNFPFNLLITPLIASLAAGNTAILKPSERTPNTSHLVEKMAEELFSPDEVCVFNGGPEVSKALVQLPFNHVFFTGSSKVGKEIMKAAAENLAGITLELGGKSPAIVDDSASIKDSSEKIIWGKFLNCGQTCIAPDYLLVDKTIKKVFIDQLRKDLVRLFAGDAQNIQTSKDYGRIVDKIHTQRLNKLLVEAIEKGASIITGGIIDEESTFFEPTILDNVSTDSLLMHEEIFGPILPVFTYEKLEEAIDLINAKPKPLALYFFSSSKKNTQLVLDSTTSGSCVVNDCVLQYSHPNLPFGGINNSGHGRSHGFSGFKQFSNEKPVLKQRTGITALKFLYPPYTGLVGFFSRIFTRYL